MSFDLVVIKNETIVDAAEFDLDSNFFKENPSIKTEMGISEKEEEVFVRTSSLGTPIKNQIQSSQVIVRVERIDCGPIHQSIQEKDNQDRCDTLDGETSKSIDENHQKRSRRTSPVRTIKKKAERTKKKTDKVCFLFFLFHRTFSCSSRPFH